MYGTLRGWGGGGDEIGFFGEYITGHRCGSFMKKKLFLKFTVKSNFQRLPFTKIVLKHLNSLHIL